MPLILHEETGILKKKSVPSLDFKTPCFLQAAFTEEFVRVQKRCRTPLCLTLHFYFVSLSLPWKLLFREVMWDCFSAAELCHSLTPKQVFFISLLNGKIFWMFLEHKTWSSPAALTSSLVSQFFPGQHSKSCSQLSSCFLISKF